MLMLSSEAKSGRNMAVIMRRELPAG